MRDAVGDLVEVITTYKSKGRIAQIMMSTLFKKRQDDAEAVIDGAIGRLQAGSFTGSIHIPCTGLNLPSCRRRCQLKYGVAPPLTLDGLNVKRLTSRVSQTICAGFIRLNRTVYACDIAICL